MLKECGIAIDQISCYPRGSGQQAERTCARALIFLLEQCYRQLGHSRLVRSILSRALSLPFAPSEVNPYSGNVLTISSNTGESGNGCCVPTFRHPHEPYANLAGLSGRTSRCASRSGRLASSASCKARP